MANWGGSDEEIDLDNHDDDDDEGSDGEDDDDEDSESNDDVIEDETALIFIRTFHNGDYDQEFDDKLIYDRCAILPAQSKQVSYNKPDNWRERNQIGLELLIEGLQNRIDRWSHNRGFDLRLTHNSRFDQQLLMDNDAPIVWHEPVLDIIWNRISVRVKVMWQLDRKIADISNIYVENVEMKKERLAALVDIIVSGRATNSCKNVTFSNTNLCGEGIKYLSKLVETSLQLQSVYLLHNRIDNMDSARCLSRSLKLHACITWLDLSHCDLGSNPEILSVILQSEVKNIHLGSNNIDSLGAVKIAEYLESNPPIEELTLDHNRLNDDDAILISQALKRNTNLTAINLCSNNLTSIGVKALLISVFDSSSLNAISQSNHKLENINFFLRDNELEDCIDRLLELDRTEKILLALRDKDSLLKYLANVPVELIPDVLEFPQRVADEQHYKHLNLLYSTRHVHLNIVYSTMRWWNMPMLYSYHSCVKSDTKRKRDN